MEKTIKKDKKVGGKGVYWALAFAVMSFLAGLNDRKDGNISQSDDYFIAGVLTLIGIGMSSLVTRRKMGNGFTGSKLIEGIFFAIVLYVFVTGFVNTGWSNSPLTWFVVPIWVLVAYLLKVFWTPIIKDNEK